MKSLKSKLQTLTNRPLSGGYSQPEVLDIINKLTHEFTAKESIIEEVEVKQEELPVKKQDKTKDGETNQHNIKNTSSYQDKIVIKRGDVFLGYSANGKKRPMVVLKKVKDFYTCVPLTTTNDEYALIPHNSRFFRSGFISKQILLIKRDIIINNFAGVLDDNKTLNQAIKTLKIDYPNFL